MTSPPARAPWYRYWQRTHDQPTTQTVRDDLAAAGGNSDGADQPEMFHVKQSPGSDEDHVASGRPDHGLAGNEPPVHGVARARQVDDDVLGGGQTGLATDREATGLAADREATGLAADRGETEPAADRIATILAVANQKGGVGKTTTAVSLAAVIAQAGQRVLLVDLDPQGNASSGLGLRLRPGEPTVYDVLLDDLDAEKVLRSTEVPNLQLIPANIDLAGAEIEMVSSFNRERKLRRALEGLRATHDLIIVDCPPSLGLLTVNALSAAQGIIVPIQCEYYALEGLGALRRNADLIRTHLNPELEVVGYILTMLDARTRLTQGVVAEVESHFGDQVFKNRIPRTVRLAEAPSFGQPITVFDPAARGARAYQRLAAELLARLDRLPRHDAPAHLHDRTAP